VYTGTLRPTSISSLAQCVQTAFGSGDSVAIGILRGAADELESSALSVARRLELIGTTFPFVLAGGMFKAVPWLRDELERRLTLASPGSQTTVLEIEPAAGAVRLAIAEAHGGARIPSYTTT
jgi:N-acetylglucosamine kinase-like BadF-type ATPase